MSFFKKTKPPQAEASGSPGANGRASTSSDPNAIADGLGRLSLGNGADRRRHSDRPPERRQEGGRPPAHHGFVGGFSVPPPQKHEDAMDWESIPSNGHARPLQGTSHSAPAMHFPMPQAYVGSFPPAGPLPTPPTVPMPVPHAMSRTMMHALGGEPPSAAPPPPPSKQNLVPPAPSLKKRPVSDSSAFPANNHLQVPPTTPQRPHLHPSPNSAPAKPVSSGPSRPPVSTIHTPPRRRSQSSPPSPTSAASSPGKNVRKVQCCAITKQDKRCTRRIPVSNPLALLNGEEEPQYCHQHIKSAFIDVKFPSHKLPGVDVSYAGEVLHRYRPLLLLR